MDLLDRMLGHDRWATLRLLEHSRDLDDAQLDQEFDIGYRTLRATLTHLISTINFWTSQVDGREPDRPYPADHPTIPELIKRYERQHAALAATARTACDGQRLDDTFVDIFGTPQTNGATIVHVLHHSAQHRSEAKHLLERLGVEGIWDLDPQEWENSTRLGLA